MKIYLLGNIANVQTGPFGSQLHKEDYVEFGTPMVTVEHLGNRAFTKQNLPMISDSDKKRLNKYVLNEGDIVFSRVGSVDRCSYVDNKHLGWMFSGRCLRIRPCNVVYPLYLYYYFCMENTKQFIRNIAVGATMPSINTKLMKDLEVPLPTMEIQQKIASILSALDDKIELNNKINENLTYAVRDGIISHCGEVDQNGIFPRKEAINLSEFSSPGKFQPYTWEGCVVKIADKIAYLGRDIEDAIRMHFIDEKDFRKLIEISKKYGEKVINTTVIIHNFITSICENSSPNLGIRLSNRHNEMLKEIKDYNTIAIYKNHKFDVYRKYAALIIRSVFKTLMDAYSKENTPKQLKKMIKTYPILIKDFLQHIDQYSTLDPNNPQIAKKVLRCKNNKIYGNLETEEIYAQAIVDFISGMTDRYAVTVFNELLRY